MVMAWDIGRSMNADHKMGGSNIMISIESLATFFGWCTVINVGLIFFIMLLWNFFHEGIARIHAKIFGVTAEEAKVTFFRVFQQYRLALAVLNLVPYVVLKIMA